MPRIDAVQSHRPAGARLAAPRAVAVGVVAVMLAAGSGTARAALPTVGAWESGSRSEPRVSFDVGGPARSRVVRRVSFPITCKGRAAAIGWGSTDLVGVRRGGRFTAYDMDAVLRGRFIAGDRAEVTVRTATGSDCSDTRRYVVRHAGHRVAVPTGRFLSLVGGGATVELDTTAFGRMVDVDAMDGSLTADCSDGSPRALTLAGPDRYVLAAPIRPSGRFDISATDGSSIRIAGSFHGGSVAAFVALSVVLPTGPRCTARTQPLVGALAFPLASGGEAEAFPSPPSILQHPG